MGTIILIYTWENWDSETKSGVGKRIWVFLTQKSMLLTIMI